MAEYYALQAAFCFSVAHIFVRRGLVHSNALTGSLISLGTSAVGILDFSSFCLPRLLHSKSSSIGYFAAAGLFAPAIGQTLGLHRHGAHRRGARLGHRQHFTDLFVHLCGVASGRTMAGAEHSGHVPRDRWHRRTLLRPRIGYYGLAQKGHRFPAPRGGRLRHLHPAPQARPWSRCPTLFSPRR